MPITEWACVVAFLRAMAALGARYGCTDERGFAPGDLAHFREREMLLMRNALCE